MLRNNLKDCSGPLEEYIIFFHKFTCMRLQLLHGTAFGGGQVGTKQAERELDEG